MGNELAADTRASEVKAGGRNLPRKDAPERGSRERVAPRIDLVRLKDARQRRILAPAEVVERTSQYVNNA